MRDDVLLTILSGFDCGPLTAEDVVLAVQVDIAFMVPKIIQWAAANHVTKECDRWRINYSTTLYSDAQLTEQCLKGING